LKTEVATKHDDLVQEIALTQRLLEESVKTINKFAKEFSIPDEV
jgi:hypothetical protein